MKLAEENENPEFAIYNRKEIASIRGGLMKSRTAITPMDFVPLYLPAKTLSDDSCWDEYESEYEESFPNHVLALFNEAARD